MQRRVARTIPLVDERRRTLIDYRWAEISGDAVGVCRTGVKEGEQVGEGREVGVGRGVVERGVAGAGEIGVGVGVLVGAKRDIDAGG